MLGRRVSFSMASRNGISKNDKTPPFEIENGRPNSHKSDAAEPHALKESVQEGLRHASTPATASHQEAAQLAPGSPTRYEARSRHARGGESRVGESRAGARAVDVRARGRAEASRRATNRKPRDARGHDARGTRRAAAGDARGTRRPPAGDALVTRRPPAGGCAGDPTPGCWRCAGGQDARQPPRR